MGAGQIYPKSHETILFYKKDNSYFKPPARKGYGEYVRNSIQKDDGGWYYTRRMESSGGRNYLKTYISTNSELSKEEALEEASRKRPQPAWSSWIGKEDVAELYNNDFGVGTYAFTEDENVGYTTQKPPTLLNRIINASSDEYRDANKLDRMVIADFFGGSGVAAKVANELKRNFIHVDVGINSIQTTRDLLVAVNAEFDIYEIKDGVNLFRNPTQTMDKLAKLIPGLQRNTKGLSKYWFGKLNDSKLGMIPVYIPDLRDHTQRVFDKPIANQLVNQELGELENVKKVVVYYIDLDDKKEIEQFIKEQNNTEIAVELRDVKQVLSETVIDDIVEYKAKEEKVGYCIEIKKIISDRLLQKIDEYNQKGLAQPSKQDDEQEEENGNGNGENGETGQAEKKKKKFSPITISKSGLELIELVSLDCTNRDGIWKSDKEIKIDKYGYVIEDGQKTKNFWDAKIRCEKKPLRMKVRNIAGDEIIIEKVKLQ
jgi:adenine-specific DNA-methyltransferase